MSTVYTDLEFYLCFVKGLSFLNVDGKSSNYLSYRYYRIACQNTNDHSLSFVLWGIS